LAKPFAPEQVGLGRAVVVVGVGFFVVIAFLVVVLFLVVVVLLEVVLLLVVDAFLVVLDVLLVTALKVVGGGRTAEVISLPAEVVVDSPAAALVVLVTL
jgi:hypothetical protein